MSPKNSVRLKGSHSPAARAGTRLRVFLPAGRANSTCPRSALAFCTQGTPRRREHRVSFPLRVLSPARSDRGAGAAQTGVSTGHTECGGTRVRTPFGGGVCFAQISARGTSWRPGSQEHTSGVSEPRRTRHRCQTSSTRGSWTFRRRLTLAACRAIKVRGSNRKTHARKTRAIHAPTPGRAWAWLFCGGGLTEI